MHQNKELRRIRSMEKDYQKLFQGLETPEVPFGLEAAVYARIDHEARKASRIKFAIFAPLTLISGFAVVASFQYLAQASAQSGIGEYVSIIFSDGSTLAAYWKEFLISLAEQAPVFGVIMFMSAVLALLGSFKSAFKNAQIIFSSTQLIA